MRTADEQNKTVKNIRYFDSQAQREQGHTHISPSRKVADSKTALPDQKQDVCFSRALGQTAQTISTARDKPTPSSTRQANLSSTIEQAP